jgi:predicted metal-dependent HD superfamily phosphohydrolase
MIILTQHNYPSTDPEAQLLLDCDLIAMADPTLYAYNGANIRKEYSHVPDDAFYKGRAEFLQKLLDKDKILYILDGEDDIRFNIGRERGYE